jgi:hypothetical protein
MRKKILVAVGILFLLFNVVCFLHAYKFTHFANPELTRTGDPKQLSLGEKLKALLTGIDNPKPTNKNIPGRGYETITIASDVNLECWQIKVPQSKGTVILFHGYAGEKSS